MTSTTVQAKPCTSDRGFSCDVETCLGDLFQLVLMLVARGLGPKGNRVLSPEAAGIFEKEIGNPAAEVDLLLGMDGDRTIGYSRLGNGASIIFLLPCRTHIHDLLLRKIEALVYKHGFFVPKKNIL